MSSSSVTSSPPAFAWHPKLTPYRLAFFGVTGGLGISKAILVSQGQVAYSTTVEWIAGVVVALSFQFLNAYEYELNRPVYIDWVFSYDCLSILKPFIHYISGPPLEDTASSAPQIQLENQQATGCTFIRPHIVTAYRLSVSTSVALFGVMKMLCTYLGVSAAANTFDWIVAIPLTLGLYYVGLYEGKKSDVPRRFFDFGYSRKTTLLLQIVVKQSVALLWVLFKYVGIGVIPCVFWIRWWYEVLHTVIAEDEELSSTSPNALESRAMRAYTMTSVIWFLTTAIVGLWYVSIVLSPIIKWCSGKYARSIRYYISLTTGLVLYACFFLMSVCLFLSFLFFCFHEHFHPPIPGSAQSAEDGTALLVLAAFRTAQAGIAVLILATMFTRFYGFFRDLLSNE